MKTKNLMRCIFGLGLSGMYYLVSGYDQAGLVLCLGSTCLTVLSVSIKKLHYKNMLIHFFLFTMLAEGLLSSQPVVTSPFHGAILLFVVMGVFLVELLDQAKEKKRMEILNQFDSCILLCTLFFCLLLLFPLSILQWFQFPSYQQATRSAFLVLPFLFFFPMISVECTLFYRKMKETLGLDKSIQQVMK